MPKIPTFTARATPTTEVASIKTGLKLSPTATPAAGLLPAAQAIDNYFIKQRGYSYFIFTDFASAMALQGLADVGFPPRHVFVTLAKGCALSAHVAVMA